MDLVDLFDPRPGLALLELAGAIAGVDRWELVTYEGGLGCNWPSLDIADAPGAAAGTLSRAIVVEPRSGGGARPKRPCDYLLGHAPARSVREIGPSKDNLSGEF